MNLDVHTMPADRLSTHQRQIVWIALGTYTAFYLGRLNLSVAMPVIADEMAISLGEVGILGTVFFWCYAAGQIINGQLGNHIRPQVMIFLGIVMIAVTNILFSAQSGLRVMAALWGINGFAQAAGWGPMLHILSTHLTVGQKQRLSTLFSMSFQIGIALSWGLSGMLLAVGNWRTVFWVPGTLLLGVALLWHWSGLDAEKVHKPLNHFQWVDVRHEIRQFMLILVVAACTGFIYIGFLLWLPTFISDWEFLPACIIPALTAIVPLVGIPGMQLAGLVLSRHPDVLHVITLFLIGLCGCLLLSQIVPTAMLRSLFVLIAIMAVSGLAGLILSSAPMLLVTDGRVSSAGGLLTAVWSIGGGLSGTVVGSVAVRAGWTTVFALWAGFSLISLVAIRFSRHSFHLTQGAN
jgi:sugar phosphate permease